MPPLRLDMSPEACNDRLALYVGVAKLSEGPHGCAYSVRHTRSKKLCTMHVVEWEDLNAGSKEANDALEQHYKDHTSFLKIVIQAPLNGIFSDFVADVADVSWVILAMRLPVLK
jgi:hypothetical protein